MNSSTFKETTVAREVAREAVTVLKNQGNVLPLSKSATLRVFGSSAQVNPDGANSCTDKACNKGVLGMGWGSGTANYPYLDAPIDAIKRAVSNSANVAYYSSDNFPSGLTVNAEDIALVFITR
jgi:beta-glucosidase